jgi:hypothetical protein
MRGRVMFDMDHNKGKRLVVLDKVIRLWPHHHVPFRTYILAINIWKIFLDNNPQAWFLRIVIYIYENI